MPTEREILEGRRFDGIAAEYDTQARYPVRALVRQRASQILRTASPATVLDVGCGTGMLLVDLAPHIRHGIGLDVSRAMLGLARRKAAVAGVGAKLRFRYAGFSDLPKLVKRGLRCDAAVAVYSLHHLFWHEKAAAILAMMKAVAGVAGVVVIGDLMTFQEAESVSTEERLRAAYDPATDRPERPERLAALFRERGWKVRIDRVHDLAGLLIATAPRLATDEAAGCSHEAAQRFQQGSG